MSVWEKSSLMVRGPVARLMPLKAWLAAEAARLGIKPHALYMRMGRGRHPKPEMVPAGLSGRCQCVRVYETRGGAS